MACYFAGLDLSNSLFKGDSRASPSSSFLKLDKNLTNIQVGLNLIAYQKLGTAADSTWFVNGSGLSEETQLFNSQLKVSQVCLTSDKVIGLSKNTQKLYKIILTINYETGLYFDLKTEVISDPESGILLTKIFQNDASVFALDDTGNIYEVGSTLPFTLTTSLHPDIKITKIACGYSHFVALTDTGALYSWGSGGRGELGHLENDHVMTNCLTPKRIDFFDDLPSVVTDICCGGWHTLALTSEGDVYLFGWNESGQLGYDIGLGSPGVPFPIDLGSALDPVTNISAGSRHSLIVLKSGRVFAFGFNKFGQLGSGDFENRKEPREIITLCNEHVNYVSCGRWCSFIYLQK